MSNRIVLNSNEIATNEDVQSAQDWLSRDLSRVLEGLTFGSLDHKPSSGFEGGAIVSGLEVSLSSSNLTAVISPGVAVFFDESVDTTKDSPYKIGTLTSPQTVTLKPASPVSRWDLIEISLGEVTTSELRRVKGPSGFTDTSVPKVVTRSITARVRQGDSLFKTLPVITLAGYLPLAGLKVSAGASTLSNSVPIDFRKMASNFSPSASYTEPFGLDGFSRPVSFSVKEDNFTVSTSRNTAIIGQYRGPVSSSLSVSALGLATELTESPLVTLDDSSPDSFPASSWRYLYAYRPSFLCGYTSLCFSPVPPRVPGSSGFGPVDGIRPSSAFSPPAPFNPAELIGVGSALYMGAFLTYTDSVSSTTKILPSVKSGGFTRQTYLAEAPSTPPSAASATGGEIIDPNSSIVSSILVNPRDLLVGAPHPMSATMVRVDVRLRSSSSFPVGTLHTFRFRLVYAGSSDESVLDIRRLDSGEVVSFMVDIPLPETSYKSLIVDTDSTAVSGNIITLRAVGFFEAV